MKKVLILVAVISVISVSSCSNGASSGSNEGNGSNTEQKVNHSEKSDGATKRELKIAGCLEKFDHDYASLLTLEDIASHHELDLSRVETDVSSTKGEYGSVRYSWASDRPDMEIKVLSTVVKTADNNHVELKMMSFYDDGSKGTIAYFERGYKKLSEKELAEAYANLEKSFKDEPEKLEQAKGFMEIRKNSKYVEVQDLGTRSYWKWGKSYGGELVTLVGSAKFTVVTKISDDPDMNLVFAKKLAQEVIDKCN